MQSNRGGGFLFVIYSRSASAILQALAHIENVHLLLYHTTDHPDQSIAPDWLLNILDLDLIRMDHPFGLLLPFRCLSLFFRLTYSVIKWCLQRKSMAFAQSFILFHLSLHFGWAQICTK